MGQVRERGGVGKKGGKRLLTNPFLPLPLPSLSFLTLVPFFARPKPKIPFFVVPRSFFVPKPHGNACYTCRLALVDLSRISINKAPTRGLDWQHSDLSARTSISFLCVFSVWCNAGKSCSLHDRRLKLGEEKKKELIRSPHPPVRPISPPFLGMPSTKLTFYNC